MSFLEKHARALLADLEKCGQQDDFESARELREYLSGADADRLKFAHYIAKGEDEETDEAELEPNPMVSWAPGGGGMFLNGWIWVALETLDDLIVGHRDQAHPEQRAQTDKLWMTFYDDGSQYGVVRGFDTEAEALAAQRIHRELAGLDLETGEQTL